MSGFNIGPYDGNTRANLKKSDFVKGILGVTVIFGMIVLYVFEI